MNGVLDVLAGRGQWAVEQGDVLERLALIPDESVNCVVTSPPYFGLRDYGTATWVGGDPACQHTVRTAATMAKQMTSSGLEGSKKTVGHSREGFKQTCSRCLATRVDRQIGLEATPAAYVERMVAVFREVRRVLRADGTCWVNLGDSYASNPPGNTVPRDERPRSAAFHAMGTAACADRMTRAASTISAGLQAKQLLGMPWRVAFALQADGWWLRSDVIWAKPNPMPESVTDRPTRSHEYLFLLTKSARYWYDADAISEPVTKGADGSSFLVGKTVALRPDVGRQDRIERDTRNKRSVWTIATEPYPDAHFATMPTALVEPCIKAGCPVGGVVLDPFVGSGTVILEALRHGRRGIGFDLNPTYVEMARRRIVGDSPMFNQPTDGAAG